MVWITNKDNYFKHFFIYLFHFSYQEHRQSLSVGDRLNSGSGSGSGLGSGSGSRMGSRETLLSNRWQFYDNIELIWKGIESLPQTLIF